MTQHEAVAYIRTHHRHHRPPRGGVFCLQVVDPAGVRHGVAVAGRPVSRILDDGLTLEVNRVATDGAKNACSALYSACRRVGQAMGYQRILTYTLASEPGTSLRAAGWKQTGEVTARRWNCPSRRREVHPVQAKIRWEG